MLSTSRDDAFSNNLRQYDALWFVNGRGPGDGDGAARRFRCALMTYLREPERHSAAYFRKARFRSATVEALIARNECTLRHVRRHEFPAPRVRERSYARDRRQRNQKDTRPAYVT